MKHIVFLLGSYYPESNAASICVKNVVAELARRGHKCECVCFTKGKSRNDIIDTIPVYRVNNRSYLDIDTHGKWYSKMYKNAIHLIHSIVALPFFPNTRPRDSKNLFNKLYDVTYNKKIDAIIAVYNPFTTIGAAMRFHQVHKQVPIIGWFLDLIIDTTKPTLFPSFFFQKLCKAKEIRTFRELDHLLIPEGKKSYYDIDQSYNFLANKITYFNFPTLTPRPIHTKESVHNNRFIFAGTTHSQYRNPLYAIRLIIKLAADIENVHFDMYGPSDIERQLVEMQQDCGGVFEYHGTVPKEVVDNTTEKSDFLVSIGNSVPGMVASKTFELFSLARPIVHFTEGKNVDTSLPYIEKYPDVCIINCKDDISKSVHTLEVFLKRERIQVDYSVLKTLYYSATPEALANKLLIILN